MKKHHSITLLLFILLSLGCKSKGNQDNYLKKEYKITSSYIIIPVQEKSKETKISVQLPGSKEPETYWIRIAEDKPDYWVKLDVGDYKDKTIQINFLNAEKAVLGINKIYQSDKFDVHYEETYRSDFHFSPEYGWMNDPNGLVYLDGEYHLFYQYNPYGNMWGNMHWGHAVSTDLTSWTYLPIALKPDTLGDIFSGSAVVDVNNTAGFGANAIVAIYTSNGKTQQQSIAYSTDRGRTFTKYNGNPVISNPGIVDFRDPKVSWNTVANQWVMALATKQTVTFYGSKNLKDWTKLSEFGAGIGSHAGVWECPDLFPLEYDGQTKWVLTVSLHGGPNGGTATQYFIGNFNGKSFKADILPYPLWIDYGRDNYAGITWNDIPYKDGRRIFIGWMNNWDYANNIPTKFFRSSFTLARQLFLKNNGQHLILASLPVNEVNMLRDKSYSFEDIYVTSKSAINQLIPNNDGSYEINFNIENNNSNSFGFSLTNNKNESLDYHFDLSTGILNLNRSNSGLINFNDKFSLGMGAPLVPGKKYNVRLLIDKASAELFVNDGDITMTSLLFPSEVMNKLIFHTENGSINIRNIKVYDIK